MSVEPEHSAEYRRGRDDALKMVFDGLQKIPSACHSRSGLLCGRDDWGYCFLIDRGQVLALITGNDYYKREDWWK